LAAVGQAQLDLVGRQLAVDPGHREQPGRVAAQDLAAGVALQAEPAADAQVAGDRQNQRLSRSGSVQASQTSWIGAS
jgi:hypothetical protein